MWNEAPDFYEVETALKNLARIRGEILRQDREIQKAEDSLKEKYPRKPELRRRELEALYDNLTELKVQEIDAMQVVEFNRMRLDMFKTYNFKR